MFIFLRKSHKKISFFIICTFILIVFILFSDITIFASDVLSPELFNNSNKVISDDVSNTIKNIYDNNEKIAYLTFDDGPTKKVTPKVLDILDNLNVKANFFVVGKHVKEFPALVKREYNSGHFIANHGYSHSNKKLYQSKESFLTEIVKTDIEISKAIEIDNYRCHLFRFPNRFYE